MLIGISDIRVKDEKWKTYEITQRKVTLSEKWKMEGVDICE